MYETIIPSKRPGFDLEQDFGPIFRGEAFLPNFKELPLDDGIGVIASGSGLVTRPGSGPANVKIPGSAIKAWARYFLSTTQSGVFDGTGYVIWYSHGKGRVGTFAICKHVKVPGPGANPSRGWSPGHCSKCGVDMTVDSGD